MVAPAEDAVSCGSATRRMSLITVDQGLSSLSNLLVLVVVAHVLMPVDFGLFSLMFLIYAVAQAGVRSVVSVPVLVHPEDATERPREPLGASVILGVICMVLCFGAAGVLWLMGSTTAMAVAVLAACLAPLLIQDVGRYLAFARGVPGLAILLDVVWLVLAVLGFVLARMAHVHSLAGVVLAWAGSGALAGCVVFVQYGLPGSGDLNLAWIRSRWGFVWRSLVSNVAAQGVGLLGATVAAAVSSPVVVAVVRASLLAGRPSATVQGGVGASIAADVAREDPADHGLRLMWRALVISVAVAVVNLVGLLVLPDVLGRAVLGDVWPLVKPLVLPIGLFGIAAAVHTAVQAVLIGRHEMGRVLRIELFGAVLAVICLVGGSALGGAAGALWGTLLGQTLASIAWAFVFAFYLRRSARVGTGPRHRRQRVLRGVS